MNLIAKLLFGQIARHPARFLLTTLAIVAASGVVIWVVSGYDALVAQFDEFSEEYLGRYQYIVVAETMPTTMNAEPPALSPTTIAEIARDPAIKEVAVESQIRIKMKPAEERPAGDRPPSEGKGKGKGKGKGRGGRPGGGPGGGSPGDAEKKKTDTSPATDTAGSGPKQTKEEAASTLSSTRTPGNFGPPAPPTLVGTDATAPPYPMASGRWLDPKATTPEAVISARSAEQHDVRLGDRLIVEKDKREITVNVVGIVEQVRTIGGGGRGGPGPSRGPATSALYVPLAQVEELLGAPAPITIAQILLSDVNESSAFFKRQNKVAATSTPALAIITASDVESDLENSSAAERARNQAYSATGIALLAALFIIFTALSMGVHERARQFAVLRAVALTPSQIGWVILLESLLLGAIGWVGGLTAGWGLLRIMSVAQPTLFTSSPILGTWCLALSGACAFGGALAAAIFPAWRAMRISPLDAMSAPITRLSGKVLGSMTLVGLLLVIINPLLVFAWPMQDSARYGIYVAIGCSTMAVGFLLLTPLAIQLVEKLLGPLLARILWLDP